MNMLISLILYILSFIAIWFGAGIVIKSVDKIAHRLRLSSFAVSFFVLGILTSIPEAAVSINAVIDKRPEVFVGTLLGGIIVIFLFIIPLLAILGKGVKLNHSLDNKSLIGLLAVIAAPGLVVIDHKVTNFEGILLVLAYVVIFYFIQRKHGFLQENNTEILSTKSYSFLDLAKVAAGIGIVFISSRFIVSQTLSFAEILNIPAFYISIIVLSLGANIPEISIAVRAIISGKKDIAFGDYLGSAASNVLLFGIFTLVNDGEVFTFDSFIITFLFIASGLGLFYYFAQSKEEISKKEGFILLGIYVIFVLFEIGNGLFG